MFAEDEDGRKYIETMPRRGYRFVAEARLTTPVIAVERIDDARSPKIIEKHTIARIITEEEIEDTNELHLVVTEVSPDAGTRKLLTSGEPSLWQRRKLPIAILIFVLLAGAVALILYLKPSRQTEIKTVAVLPLKSLDASDDQSLGLKLADALILRLGRLQQIVVRPTRAVQGYEGKALDPIAAGREQEVDAVLDGSFQRAGERLRVRVQLLRVSDGRQLWAGTFDERSADPFFIQDALAEQTARAIVPQLAGAERQLVTRRDTENAEANRLYTEGRYHWNRRNIDGLKKSVIFFEKAIELDPNYARAYAGLADSYSVMSDFDILSPTAAYPKVKGAALRALAIDDTLAEAHTALAMIKASYEWDWRGAEQAFQRAIQLNPNYATAHQWYSEYLTAMGRHEEALAEIHRAHELDPLSLIIRSVEAWVWYHARDYDRMLAQCEKVLEMDPNFSLAYAYIGCAYERKGMYQEAIEANQKRVALMKGNDSSIVASRPSPPSGAEDYWRKRFEVLKPISASFDAAEAFAQLGEADRAIAMLEQSYAEHTYRLMYLKVHPNLDPLRADPRFQSLLRRTGLAE